MELFPSARVASNYKHTIHTHTAHNMNTTITFYKTINADGKRAFEMRISGTPWGRFNTERDGLNWAKLNNLV